MATKPYFPWGDTRGTSIAASDSDVGVFRSSSLETAAALAAATAPATDTALVAPELGAAAVARPRRRDSSLSAEKRKKQQQQAGGGGVVVGAAKKPPQRGLGVAELERLRCGGDPLLELSTVVGDAAAGAQGHTLLDLSAVVGDAAAAGGAQGHGHPLLQYHQHHHRHLQMSATSAFEAVAGARYCSQLLAPEPPPPPPGPVCVLHPPAAAPGGQRAPPVAPEQQYFRDRWSRMGGFSTPTAGGGADHRPLSQLLPATLAPPEHPSSQSTIWRPAVSSSSCLHAGHRCDICSRRMRASALAALGLAENGGALAPTPQDYSIYDLATDMATARQGDTFMARERKQGPAESVAPAKKDVREIEFFPAASAHQTGGGGRVSVPGESELAAPFSCPHGTAAASHTAPLLDLSLRL